MASSSILVFSEQFKLEHAAELEEPFAVTGVAQAAADKERAYGGFRQESQRYIVGKVAASSYPVHFANFVGTYRVHLLAHKRRQREQIANKAGSDQVILIALKFVIAVGAEAQRPSQEKLRDSGVRCAKRRAAFAFHKK